jgi:hypothetical protein
MTASGRGETSALTLAGVAAESDAKAMTTTKVATIEAGR